MNLTLTNTTGETLSVYLLGTVEEANDGAIVEGKSVTIKLPPYYSGQIDPRKLEPSDIEYTNGEYEDLVTRTGTMPEGIYDICITVLRC